MIISRMPTDAIPVAVREVAATLQAAGYRSWIVGGCVRDLLMHRTPNDWDLCTDALPEDVMKVFPVTIPTGIDHGTITVRQRGESYEVTTLRGDGAYTDGRRPDSVEFITDLDQDLARRDFTMNAIAMDPVDGNIFDPFGGQVDMERGLIRCVGNPMERFEEDGLRILRAVRFAANLGSYKVTDETSTAMRACRGKLANVSMERVHAEFKKIFERSCEPSVRAAFRHMYELGILEQLHFPVNAKFIEDNLTLVGLSPTFAALHTTKFERGMAAMLLYTPPEVCEEFLRELKCSNQERARILHLVKVLQKSPRAIELLSNSHLLRIWAHDVGRDCFDDAFTLHFHYSRYQQVKAVTDPAVISLSELAVRGNELPVSGKTGGQHLRNLLDWVLEDPSRNTREQLLERSQWMKENLSSS